MFSTQPNISELKNGKAPEHTDKLGQPIKLNDCVAYPDGNSLNIGRVVKLNPKMIGVEEVGSKRWQHKGNKYPQDMVVIDQAAVTMFLLKNQ